MVYCRHQISRWKPRLPFSSDAWTTLRSARHVVNLPLSCAAAARGKKYFAALVSPIRAILCRLRVQCVHLGCLCERIFHTVLWILFSVHTPGRHVPTHVVELVCSCFAEKRDRSKEAENSRRRANAGWTQTGFSALCARAMRCDE